MRDKFKEKLDKYKEYCVTFEIEASVYGNCEKNID